MQKTKIMLATLVALLIGGCMSQIPNFTREETMIPTQPPDTSTPTIKRFETATLPIISTLSPTPLSTLTWTPLPTLSPQDADAKIKELLERNGKCELPCWWGITPNKTTWAEASYLLVPLLVNIRQGGSRTYYENGNKHLATVFEVSYDVNGSPQSRQIAFEVEDNMVVAINVFPPTTQYKHQLHQVLKLLGTPKQIYISAQSRKPWSESFTTFVLDYSKFGVWAFYTYVPTITEERFSVCPDSTGGELFLFDPAKEYTQGVSIIEAAEMFKGVPARELEDVTNMTIDDFYNAFVDPDSNACLETPANLWP